MTMKNYRYATMILLAMTLIAPMLLTACGKSVSAAANGKSSIAWGGSVWKGISFRQPSSTFSKG